MRIKNSKTGYGAIAIILHWAIAILIIGLLGSGLYMAGLPISFQKLKLYGLHKEIGISVLMLTVIRLAWRLNNITPSLATLPWWERVAARAMHWAFYGFMFAVPLTGWLMSSAAGLPVSFFGLFVLPDFLAPNDAHMKLLQETHKWLAYALIAAIIGHTGAAFKHHFIDKDDILRRMLSWLK